MILRLLVPFLETFAVEGIVVKWHVKEGDPIQFGDPICDITLSQWLALRKTKRAINLVKITSKGQGNVKHNFEKREGRGELVMRVVASEAGYLRYVRAPEGRTVNVGDLLAWVSSDLAEPVTEDLAAPAMRVVASTKDVMEESI